MAELINHGTTGYLVRDIDAAAASVEAANDLDRQAIRASTVTRFKRTKMVADYSELYFTVLSQTRVTQ